MLLLIQTNIKHVRGVPKVNFKIKKVNQNVLNAKQANTIHVLVDREQMIAEFVMHVLRDLFVKIVVVVSEPMVINMVIPLVSVLNVLKENTKML